MSGCPDSVDQKSLTKASRVGCTNERMTFKQALNIFRKTNWDNEEFSFNFKYLLINVFNNQLQVRRSLIRVAALNIIRPVDQSIDEQSITNTTLVWLLNFSRCRFQKPANSRYLVYILQLIETRREPLPLCRSWWWRPRGCAGPPTGWAGCPGTGTWKKPLGCQVCFI